jgi:hypothetical protein
MELVVKCGQEMARNRPSRAWDNLLFVLNRKRIPSTTEAGTVASLMGPPRNPNDGVSRRSVHTLPVSLRVDKKQESTYPKSYLVVDTVRRRGCDRRCLRKDVV